MRIVLTVFGLAMEWGEEMTRATGMHGAQECFGRLVADAVAIVAPTNDYVSSETKEILVMICV